MSEHYRNQSKLITTFVCFLILISISFFSVQKANAYFQSSKSATTNLTTSSYNNLTLSTDKEMYGLCNRNATILLTIGNTNTYNVGYTITFSNNSLNYTIDGAQATTYTLSGNGSKTHTIIVSGTTNTSSLTITVTPNSPYRSSHTKTVNFDLACPVCTWGEVNSTNGYLKSGSTTTYTIDCLDENGITNTELTSSSFIVSNNSLASISGVTKTSITSGSKTGYRYTVSLLGKTGNGNITLSLNENAIKDNNLNWNSLTANEQVIIDNEAPSVPTTVTKRASDMSVIDGSENVWRNYRIWWGGFTTDDNNGSGIIRYDLSYCDDTDQGDLTVDWSDIYEDGANYIFCIRAVDRAGNVSDWSTPKYIKIDTTSPSAPTYNAIFADSSGSYISGSWANKQVNTAVSSSDASSGISVIQYAASADSTSWITFDFSVSPLTKTGTTWSGTEPWGLYDRNDYRYFRAIDNAGNISAVSTVFNIRYDTTPPTISYSLTGGIYNSNQSVVVSASDTNGSGISYYNVHVYKVESNEVYVSEKSYTGITSPTYTVNLDSPGMWRIYAQAYDNAGNLQNQSPNNGYGWMLYEYIIDQTLPIVSYNLAGGTYNATQSVIVTASDANYNGMMVHVYKNGSKETGKSTDGTTAASYSVNLDSDGTWVVYTQAFDVAGNKQSQNPENEYGWYYQTYLIDTTAPTISYNVAGGTYNTAKTVTVTPSDTNYSGMMVHVAKDGSFIGTKSTDGTTATSYSVNLDSDGTWVVYTQAFDMAGNKHTQGPDNGYGWYYQVYIIDTIAPSVPTSNIRLESSAGTIITNGSWTNQTVWWGDFYATDIGGSGVQKYQYSYNCTGNVSADLWSEYFYSENTNYQFCIRAVDNASNASGWSSPYYILVDKSAPNPPTSNIRIGSSTGSIITNGAWSNQTVWWGDFYATDTGGSGIKQYELSPGCSGTANQIAMSSGYTYATNQNQDWCIIAIDNAGNSSSWSIPYYIRVDKTGPTITIPENPFYIQKDSITNLTSYVTITDGLSGPTGVTSNYGTATNLGVGTYSVIYTAADVAGNSTVETATMIVYDKFLCDGYVTTSGNGNGLYRDPIDETRCIYRGANPNNYVRFNGTYSGNSSSGGTLYRIIGIEYDGRIKIVHSSTIGNMAWHSTSSSLNYNTSTIRTYLNETYYNTLNDQAKGQIQSTKFYIGQMSYYNTTSYNITQTVTAEKTTLENNNSYVGLMNVYDFLLGSTNCSGATTWEQIATKTSGQFTCDINNWLVYPTSGGAETWFITKYSDTRIRRWLAVGCTTSNCESTNAGSIQYAASTTAKQIRPVTYLREEVIIIGGSGTASDPYILSPSKFISATSSTTCTVTTPAGYDTSKVLTIVPSQTSGIAYSWDGINYSSTMTKTIETSGNYKGYIKDATGKTNNCSINIVSRTEYQHQTCSQCKTCNYCTSSGFHYCQNHCYGEPVLPLYTKTNCEIDEGAWNSCNSKCYTWASGYSSGASCGYCGCNSWSTGDNTWYSSSCGTSNYSNCKNKATRTTYGQG